MRRASSEVASWIESSWVGEAPGPGRNANGSSWICDAGALSSAWLGNVVCERQSVLGKYSELKLGWCKSRCCRRATLQSECEAGQVSPIH